MVAASFAQLRISSERRMLKKTQRKRADKRAQMDAYFDMLAEMVPTIPRERKLSKVDILQYVIDYIQELQQRLHSHPELQIELDMPTICSFQECMQLAPQSPLSEQENLEPFVYDDDEDEEKSTTELSESLDDSDFEFEDDDDDTEDDDILDETRIPSTSH